MRLISWESIDFDLTLRWPAPRIERKNLTLYLRRHTPIAVFLENKEITRNRDRKSESERERERESERECV